MLFASYVRFHTYVKSGRVCGYLFRKCCSLDLRYVRFALMPDCLFTCSFPHLGFCSGDFFLIVRFPTDCLP